MKASTNNNPVPIPGITIVGTPSDDVIVGTIFNDVLLGRAGDDGISGGAGDDFISGGRGNDQLVGGSGNDTFFFGRFTSRNVVQDFGNGDDLLDVSRLDVDFADVNQTTNARGDTVITFDGFDDIRIVLKDAGFVAESDFLF